MSVRAVPEMKCPWWGRSWPRLTRLRSRPPCVCYRCMRQSLFGQVSLRSLNRNDRSAGQRAQWNVWQPRTALPEGAFQRRASHHPISPSRTAVSAPAPSASSSSRSASPGRGRGVSRLSQAYSIGARSRHQLEDGVHYAEAPSSVVHRRVPTKERRSYP